jgi:hypothetical protein
MARGRPYSGPGGLPISIGRADGHLGIGYRGTDRDAGRNRSVPTSCAGYFAPRERDIEDDLTSENARKDGAGQQRGVHSGTDGILNGERIAYSTLMLVTRTTLPHLSVSLSMNWA